MGITVYGYICCLLDMAPSLAIGAEAIDTIYGRVVSQLLSCMSSEVQCVLVGLQICMFSQFCNTVIVPLVIRTSAQTLIVVQSPLSSKSMQQPPKPLPQDRPC